MLELTPRLYSRSMEWSLLPRNIVDSVNMQPIPNTVNTDASALHTENFTSADINGEEYTLPISNDITPTHWRYSTNTRNVAFAGNVSFAKARVECVMASGRREIHVDTAIKGIPSVSITLTGTSDIIARGESTYNSYPQIDSIASKNFLLSSWIAGKRTHRNNFVTGDYTESSFSMNPWVRTVIEEDPTLPSIGPKPDYTDVLTLWNKYVINGAQGLHTDASTDTWSEYISFDYGNLNTVKIFAPDAPTDASDSSIRRAYGSMLSMSNAYLPIACYVTKKSDYDYILHWSAPVRVSYIAASRARDTLANYYDVDNYAYVDNITNIALTLSGYEYNTNSTNINISANDTQNHPLKINESESLTLRSYIESQPSKLWIDNIPQKLLSKYSKGKYIVTCDIPATWAIQNNIKAGTLVKIRLQSGEYISRDHDVCIFEIKNIEKRFKNSAFTYSLKLMEA